MKLPPPVTPSLTSAGALGGDGTARARTVRRAGALPLGGAAAVAALEGAAR